MNFYVMTLFPDMIMQGLGTSITGRALEKGVISVEAVNIRDYTTEKHGKTDDYPYGGGAGMVMQAQPVYDCYQAVAEKIGHKPRVVYMTPQGRVFNQKMAEDFAKEEELVLLCGHYEGIDERALELIGAEYVSIGDYVLTGGELPAMIMIDCISRLVPGVLGTKESAEIETFHDNLLEYPQYSRPEEFMGMKVPDVLLSGHHANVDKWRREQSIERTLKWRPDLLPEANLSKKEKKYLDKLIKEQQEQLKESEQITERSTTMLNKVKENLEKRGYTVSLFETAAEAAQYLNGQIDNTTVGIGGSLTVKEMGLDTMLLEHNEVSWHWIQGRDAMAERLTATTTETYISSINGMTEAGEMINIDGAGNRVAGMNFGHKRLFIIVGKNKIAPDFEQAMWRARNIAAPKNAARLGRKTPCAADGKCHDCSSPDRICNSLNVLWRPVMGMKTEVVLVNEDLGL